MHSFSGLLKTVTHQPAAMKTALALLLLISLACHSHALTCHTCVAATEDECDKDSAESCPPGSDACATVTGIGSVLKFCSDRTYCNKGSAGSSTSKVECCYFNNCNAPPGKTSGASGGPLVSRPILLITALLLGVTFTQL